MVEIRVVRMQTTIIILLMDKLWSLHNLSGRDLSISLLANFAQSFLSGSARKDKE